MSQATDDQPIFSGDYSVDMWKAVNAITDPEVADALYFVCCRLQELEARLNRLREPQEGQRK